MSWGNGALRLIFKETVVNQNQKTLKRALQKRPKLNPNKLNKRPEIVAKHRAELQGTGFEDCAPCGGCAPRTIQTEGGVTKMKCGNGNGQLVTSDVATACKGDKPPIPRPRQISQVFQQRSQ